MAAINIGDIHKDDVFYRYKMPPMELVTEGRGNGIKTKINNIDAVARALDRPPRLGTSASANILRGKHGQTALQATLSSFIDDYVLCASCTNPETTLKLNRAQDTIKTTRKACGAKYKKDMLTPYCDTIVKSLVRDFVHS